MDWNTRTLIGTNRRVLDEVQVGILEIDSAIEYREDSGDFQKARDRARDAIRRIKGASETLRQFAQAALMELSDAEGKRAGLEEAWYWVCLIDDLGGVTGRLVSLYDHLDTMEWPGEELFASIRIDTRSDLMHVRMILHQARLNYQRILSQGGNTFACAGSDEDLVRIDICS